MKQPDLNGIKYDLRQMELYRCFTVVSLILLLLDFVIFMGTENIEAAVYSVYFFPVLLILTWGLGILYLNRKEYMQRLCQCGCVLPYDKTKYPDNWDKLPQIQPEECVTKLSYGKKGLAVAAICITAGTAVYMFTLSKMPHPIVLAMMVVFMIYYIKNAFRSFYKEQLDAEAADDKKLSFRYKIRVAEFIVIFGMLLVLFHVTDWRITADDPTFYAQTMGYYKRMDANRYRFFPERLPDNVEMPNTVFHAKLDTECFVYFRVPKEDIGEINDYFNNINESKIVHIYGESKEYGDIYETMEEQRKKYLGWPAILLSDPDKSFIYEFDRWETVGEGELQEYRSMYVWVGMESGEVFMGFEL